MKKPKIKKTSAATDKILEMIDDMREGGIMSAKKHGQIVKSLVDERPMLSAKQIHDLRSQARLSQSKFADVLSLSKGHISALERGVKRPSGPVLVLLDVVRRLGIRALTGEKAA